jgi:hypothetical protein
VCSLYYHSIPADDYFIAFNYGGKAVTSINHPGIAALFKFNISMITVFSRCVLANRLLKLYGKFIITNTLDNGAMI